jgi:acyl-lipid omega-6 desaturase (Delta-12 desaturase)
MLRGTEGTIHHTTDSEYLIVLHATAAARTAPANSATDWADHSPASPAAQTPTQAFKESARRLAVHCAAYRGAQNGRAAGQIATTLLPFIAIVALMVMTVNTNYWLTLLLAIPGGGLLVRFFIIQHDCGHGSFFSSRLANDLTGRAISVLTFTPYELWRREHAQHHATSGHLEKRGVGDITTLTIEEYKALSPMRKFFYRVYRNPLFLFGFGVPFFFVFLQRLPWGHPYPMRETWKSVMGLNLALAAVYVPLGYAIGFTELVLIAWPMLHVATAVGGWLFFIQHQFEDTSWEGSDEWSFQVQALHGSSYYALHPVLNWFTGSIGMHHIHHLNSMIPNYRLPECLKASPELMELNRMTLWESFGCAKLKLWDPAARRLVTFKEGLA